MKTRKDYLGKFFFPDIPWQPYPEFVINHSGRPTNFKAEIYPTPTASRKYTRKKQLDHRSKQAGYFDFLIRIGYFDGLPVAKEFPVPIQNSMRPEGLGRGLYFMLDYFFPTLLLAVELDSDLHNEKKDKIRDTYLEGACGIRTFRIRNLEQARTQSGKFRELISLMHQITPLSEPPVFAFTNDLYKWLDKKGLK